MRHHESCRSWLKQGSQSPCFSTNRRHRRNAMTLLTVTVLALAATGAADQPAGQPAADPTAARSAIAKAVTFLEDEGTAWMNDRKCASCHHAPLTIWSLNEARNYGYAG